MKLKKTARSSKFSLLEKIPNEQTKRYLNLAHEVLNGFSLGVSKQFSKTVAGDNRPSYGTRENIDKITVQNQIYNKYTETTPLL